MPRIDWPLRNGRPCIEVVLTLTLNGPPQSRILLADTGAGSRKAGFDLILDEDDCLLCGGIAVATGTLRGAYTGSFPVYLIRVRLPVLGFSQALRAVGVPKPPAHFGGIAGFNFLSRFHYGNFGDPDRFGLET